MQCGPGEDPVVRVNMNSEGRFAFLELRSSEMSAACLNLTGQVPLMGQTLSIGRPTGYVDPGKAFAAARAAADALARFQAESAATRKAAGILLDDELETNFLCVDGMMTADILKDAGEYDEVLAEVKVEFDKYGTVLRVCAPRPTDTEKIDELMGTESYGKVLVQYLELEGAKKAKEAVHGRLFAGANLEVTYMQPQAFIDAAEGQPS